MDPVKKAIMEDYISQYVDELHEKYKEKHNRVNEQNYKLMNEVLMSIMDDAPEKGETLI